MKALLFDFDGTLLNTNDLIIDTFLHVLDEKFPGQYTREACLRFIGPSLKETFDEITPGETEAMIAKYQEFNMKYHDELAKGYDGVVETLEQLHAMGIRMAIVSTKKRFSLERGMKLLGVEHLFETYIGYDDVEHEKPHPEPVLLALQQLGVEKEEAMMIGDNYHDILAGQNAGVKTAGVCWSVKGADYLRTFNPDYMLEHMQDLIDIVKA
jgi:pyrophosphatase PpaX